MEPPILTADERLAMEAIAAVNASIQRIRDAGRVPEAIVVPVATYRALQRYRSRLGDAEHASMEYIGRYELFGLPILTDHTDNITIRSHLGSEH